MGGIDLISLPMKPNFTYKSEWSPNVDRENAESYLVGNYTGEMTPQEDRQNVSASRQQELDDGVVVILNGTQEANPHQEQMGQDVDGTGNDGQQVLELMDLVDLDQGLAEGAMPNANLLENAVEPRSLPYWKVWIDSANFVSLT